MSSSNVLGTGLVVAGILGMWSSGGSTGKSVSSSEAESVIGGQACVASISRACPGPVDGSCNTVACTPIPPPLGIGNPGFACQGNPPVGKTGTSYPDVASSTIGSFAPMLVLPQVNCNYNEPCQLGNCTPVLIGGPKMCIASGPKVYGGPEQPRVPDGTSCPGGVYAFQTPEIQYLLATSGVRL